MVRVMVQCHFPPLWIRNPLRPGNVTPSELDPPVPRSLTPGEVSLCFARDLVVAMRFVTCRWMAGLTRRVRTKSNFFIYRSHERRTRGGVRRDDKFDGM